jgi:hypothetical protein
MHQPIMVFIVIYCLFFVLQVVVGCWEKRLNWPYGAPEPQPRTGDPNGYGYARVSEALQNGFLCFGWCPDLKGEKYQVSYAMLVSPDRQFFVVIGTGTIFGLTLDTSWIFSRTLDDRLYYSTDHQNGAVIDISRLQRCQLVPRATFVDLWRRHVDWLQKDGVRTQPFDSGGEFECFHRLRSVRFGAMLKRGMIRYTDATNTWYRYTLAGSIQHVAVNYTLGIVRALTGGRLPRSA